MQGRSPLRKLYSKEQRALYATHAPKGLELDDLSILGPIFVLKLKFAPKGYARKLVAELWSIPTTRSSSSCRRSARPRRRSRSAQRREAFLTKHGIDLTASRRRRRRRRSSSSRSDCRPRQLNDQRRNDAEALYRTRSHRRARPMLAAPEVARRWTSSSSPGRRLVGTSTSRGATSIHRCWRTSRLRLHASTSTGSGSGPVWWAIALRPRSSPRRKRVFRSGDRRSAGHRSRARVAQVLRAANRSRGSGVCRASDAAAGAARAARCRPGSLLESERIGAHRPPEGRVVNGRTGWVGGANRRPFQTASSTICSCVEGPSLTVQAGVRGRSPSLQQQECPSAGVLGGPCPSARRGPEPYARSLLQTRRVDQADHGSDRGAHRRTRGTRSKSSIRTSPTAR